MYQLHGISTNLLLCCSVMVGCIQVLAGFEKSGRVMGGLVGAQNGSLSWLQREVSVKILINFR